MAKDFFESHDLSFEDYDVASDTVKRSEMMEKSGQMGVPVIVIDGQDVVIGFDRERLASLLEVEA
jgi:glutaredoxin 3